MNRIFNAIFKLPPVEERKMIGGWLRIKFFGNKFSPDKDDLYIFYLVFKWSLIIGWVISALLLLSYKFEISCGIGSFQICIPKEDFVRRFSWSFGVIFPVVYFIFILPFFYTMFRWNVDWKSYDFLWWNQKWKITDPMEKYYPVCRRAFACTLIGFCGLVSVGIYVANRGHFHESVTYLMFLALALYPLAGASVAYANITIGITFLKSRKLYLRAVSEKKER